MLEVVVALLLLAVGMLGFAALQTSSLKATNESIDRTKALSVMQSTAERIRTNPSAIPTYKSEFSGLATRAGVVAKAATAVDCGAKACDPAKLAQRDIQWFAQQFLSSNLVANIVACPRNSGTGVGNSDCLIVAWDDTSPSTGSNADSDCLTATGQYYPAASCMFMEMN